MRNRNYNRNDNRNYNRNPGPGLWSGFMLLVIGCVLIAIGLSLGGHWSYIPWWPWHRDSNFELTWNDGNGSFSSSHDESIRDIEDLSAAIPSGVTNVDIRLKAASLVIKSGASGEYRADGFGKGSVRINLDGDTLLIEETDWNHSFGFGDDFQKPSLEIVLPEGVTLATCRVNLGAGSASFDSIKADTFDVESGAGAIKGNGIDAEKVSVETGAGSIEFTESNFGDSDISSGAGRFVFDGTIGNRTDVSTGAGSVEMSVAGSEDDYRIEFERGIGSVRIGGESFNGVGNGTAGSRNADKKITLSTGVGSVKIDFSENQF